MQPLLMKTQLQLESMRASVRFANECVRAAAVEQSR